MLEDDSGRSAVNAGNGGVGGDGGDVIVSSTGAYLLVRNCVFAGGAGGMGGNGGNATTTIALVASGGIGGNGGQGGSALINESRATSDESRMVAGMGGSGGAGGMSTLLVQSTGGVGGDGGRGVSNTLTATCTDCYIRSGNGGTGGQVSPTNGSVGYGVFNNGSVDSIYDHCTLNNSIDNNVVTATTYKYCTNESSNYASIGIPPILLYNAS